MNFDQLASMEGRPLNYGSMAFASARARITGPCGDTVEIWLKIRNGRIRKASFISDGCGESWMCCSTAAFMVEGMRLEEAASLTRERVLARTPPIHDDHRHCAQLAADTIRQAIATYDPVTAGGTLGRRIKQIFINDQHKEKRGEIND